MSADAFAARAAELGFPLTGENIRTQTRVSITKKDSHRETNAARNQRASAQSEFDRRSSSQRLTFPGRFDEAEAELKRALEIEPLSAAGNVNYAWVLFYAGRPNEAEAQAKRAVELFPDFWLAHFFLFSIYRFKHDYGPAVEEFARAIEIRDEAGDSARLAREAFARGGWAGFLTAVTRDRARLKSTPYNVATFYAELGDRDQAFAALNEAVEKDDQFVGFTNVDPFLNSLHEDPRFPPLLRRLGFIH